MTAVCGATQLSFSLERSRPHAVGLRDPDAALHAEVVRWMDDVEPHLQSVSHYRLCRDAVAQANKQTLKQGVWAT